MALNDYAAYDGLGLAELIRARKVSTPELIDEAIARIERHNPKLNAVIFKTFDRARDMARTRPATGPFMGVPFLLKDYFGDQEGTPTRYGSAFMPAVPAPQNSYLKLKFVQAGFISLGKTNVPEFGLVPVTESNLYGPARNPWNPEHTPGGSSGGSAAAVAAGIVPVAHANDGGGSIRIPASCCGLVGLKPSRGRISMGPVLGDAAGGLTIDGALTRSVRDTAAVLDAVSGAMPGDPYTAPPPPMSYSLAANTNPRPLRIAFATKDLGGKSVHRDCQLAVQAAAKLCEGLGHKVSESSPQLNIEMLSGAFMPIWASSLTMIIDTTAMLTGQEIRRQDFQGLTWGLYQAGKSVTAAQYQMCWLQLHAAARMVAQWHEDYDLWLTPTLGAPPARIGQFDMQESDPQKAFAPIIDYVPFTAMQNATGQPAINVPLHWNSDGLPIGVQFVGRYGEEHTLISLAAQLERAAPWSGRHPQIWN
jgi:amidase